MRKARRRDRSRSRRPVLRVRRLRRAAARRHHRRQLRPDGRRAARPRGAGRGADRPALDLRASCATTSRRVACGLLAAGVGKGDRVGIWAPNVAEWTLVQYATAKIGAILVNINPAYRTHELEYVLNQAGISAAGRARRSFKTTDYGAMIDEVRPNCPTLRQVVLHRRRRTGTRWSSRAGRRPRRGWPRLQAELSPDDPINIQYTSGTTGFPKGATLSHHNILNNGYFVGELLRLHRGRPGLHPGALLPLLRHGDGQPGCHHARRLHGHPRRPASTRRRPCTRWPASAAPRCTACRRCSSPSSTHPDFDDLRPVARCAPGSWPARRARSR